MAATNSNSENVQKPSFETFQLFSSTASGFGIFDDPAQQAPSIPPPPCVEVLPSEVHSSVKHSVESVNLDGITLLKGRVNTQQVFGLSNSDLVPGKYEGGLKLWEGSLDLIKALRCDIKSGLISFGGKRVLEGREHKTPACWPFPNLNVSNPQFYLNEPQYLLAAARERERESKFELIGA